MRKEISIEDFYELLKRLYKNYYQEELLLADKLQRKDGLTIFESVVEEENKETMNLFVFGMTFTNLANKKVYKTFRIVKDGFITYFSLPRPIVFDENKELSLLLKIYADNVSRKNVLVETEQLNRNYFKK